MDDFLASYLLNWMIFQLNFLLNCPTRQAWSHEIKGGWLDKKWEAGKAKILLSLEHFSFRRHWLGKSERLKPLQPPTPRGAVLAWLTCLDISLHFLVQNHSQGYQFMVNYFFLAGSKAIYDCNASIYCSSYWQRWNSSARQHRSKQHSSYITNWAVSCRSSKLDHILQIYLVILPCYYRIFSSFNSFQIHFEFTAYKLVRITTQTVKISILDTNQGCREGVLAPLVKIMRCWGAELLFIKHLLD